jgi:hypothetical protein
MWSRLTCHLHARMGFKQWLIFKLSQLFFPSSLKTMEWKMLQLLNRDRKDHGLRPLFMQDDLRRVARQHSKDMARNNYFEHENLTGQNHADRLKQARISDVSSGENLAKIQGYSHPVHRAERGLMNSPGHRANILNAKYNCVGVGIHKSKDSAYIYTQNFAHRELIFIKSPPKSTRMKKGLNLHFKPIKHKRMGVLRVIRNNEIIKEKGFVIMRGKNKLSINFSTTGKHIIQLFTSGVRDKHLSLSNEIKLHVKKGYFG